MAQKLKFGNGTFATKKGSTLAYNDENNNYKPLPFTTTRDSIATRVNKEGLIEVVGNNIPRIDYKDSEDGVLFLENSATNLVLNSQKLSLSPIKNGTFTDDFAISPDGTQNASKFTAPDSDPYFYQSISFSAASYTASVYVKGIGSSIGKDFRIVLGASSSDPKLKIPSEWTRFEYTVSMPSGSANAGLEISDPAVIGDEVLIWGWQVEQGSYATSYIPTQGSSVTRQADTASGAGNSEVFSDSQGVLFANHNYENINPNWSGLGIMDSDGTVDRVIFAVQNNTQNFKVYLQSGGVVRWNPTIVIDVTKYQKVAVKYKSNDNALWINGFEVATDNTVSIMPSGLHKLSYFGYASLEPTYGKTKEIAYYDTALTDLELETLTSYRSLNELVTELNLKAL